MKATDKLRAYWSKKENDLMLCYPLGAGTKSDAHYLSNLFEGVAEELEKRGYDKTTLRFSIEPQKGNVNFASQRNQQATQEEGFIMLSIIVKRGMLGYTTVNVKTSDVSIDLGILDKKELQSLIASLESAIADLNDSIKYAEQFEG